jgi:uncharacterized membrane protein
VPDSSAGAPAENAPSFAAAPPREPEFAANPDRASSDIPPQPAVERVFQPTRIEFAATLGRTWRIYTSNLLALVVASLAAQLCGAVAGAIPAAIGAALLADRNPLGVPVFAIAMVAVALVHVFFLLGLMRFMLAVARGETINFGDLFAAGPIVVPGTIVLALLTLGTFFGAIFCFVPGLIFLLVFSPSLYVVVDRQTGIFESFRDSSAAMRGNLLTSFCLFLVAGIAVGLFTLFTCGLGGIFAAPFMSLLYAVVYLSVTGQEIADDGAPARTITFRAPGMQAT